MLQSSQYTHEAYDYPTNIRESFNDFGRTVSEKVHLLSTASSASEAASAMTAPPSAKPQPKTFAHAIARASFSASQTLKGVEGGVKTTDQDSLATALEKYAIAQEKVGEARLAQDAAIQARFLQGWSTTLNTQIHFATKARRGVEIARLNLDATKAKARGNAGFSFGGQQAVRDDEHLSDQARAEIEAKEDDFVAQVDDAAGVMKNVGVFFNIHEWATDEATNRCSTRRNHCVTSSG